MKNISKKKIIGSLLIKIDTAVKTNMGVYPSQYWRYGSVMSAKEATVKLRIQYVVVI